MAKNKTIYTNRIFSYNSTERNGKNYSRKDFSNTHNNSVYFFDCIFQSTIFHNAKFENCTIENCFFSDFEFSRVIFEQNVFKNCKFTSILFYKNIFNECSFIDCSFEKCIEYPQTNRVLDIEDKMYSSQFSYELNAVLEKARLHKYIRESNTIFKKVKQNCSKSITRPLKKISKKDGDKLGLTTKQRLAENARRKKERNKLSKQSYDNSQLGKNRKIDKSVVHFLMSKYSESELINGLEYAMEHINFQFNSLSYIIKYIDKSSSSEYL